MLRSLHLENIAVIRRCDVDFTTGFSALTGETGAGKSLLIDGLNLLLGNRVPRDLIRSGEEQATVSAVFENLSRQVCDALTEMGFACEDGSLLLQRTLRTDGKSRSYLNGQTVTLAIQKKVAEQLISIHGQSDSQKLLQKAYHQELLDQAKKMGIANRLTIIPGLPPDDPRLKAILHEADLFVLPSLHEPFGIVILEAWSAGIPVIASNAGGLKDFIRPGRNGLLFDPEHGEELVKHYDSLIGDPARRQALAAAALEDVKNYSWSALTGRLLELYEELRHVQR